MLTRVRLSRLLVSFLAGLLLVGAAVAAPASAGGGHRPTFQEVKCNQGLFKGRIPGKLHAECGLLTVKENRLEPLSDDNTVVLPIVVIPARTKTPEPDPLVMLAGGPGDGGIDAFLASGISGYPLLELAENRDVILLDQRGTGDAEPGLYCPEVYEAFHRVYETTNSTSHELKVVHDAYAVCIGRLRGEGVDVGMYNNYQSARDLRDLRRTLGIEQWNVYGQSYGTILALELMRQEPWRLRSAMLDSSVPPYSQGGMGWEYLVADVRSAFERNEAYFNYAGDFGMTLEKMTEDAQQRYNDKPFTLEVTDYATGATHLDAHRRRRRRRPQQRPGRHVPAAGVRSSRGEPGLLRRRHGSARRVRPHAVLRRGDHVGDLRGVLQPLQRQQGLGTVRVDLLRRRRPHHRRGRPQAADDR